MTNPQRQSSSPAIQKESWCNSMPQRERENPKKTANCVEVKFVCSHTRKRAVKRYEITIDRFAVCIFSWFMRSVKYHLNFFSADFLQWSASTMIALIRVIVIEDNRRSPDSLSRNENAQLKLHINTQKQMPTCWSSNPDFLGYFTSLFSQTYLR